MYSRMFFSNKDTKGGGASYAFLPGCDGGAKTSNTPPAILNFACSTCFATNSSTSHNAGNVIDASLITLLIH